jgi:ubiquinone/menaquinone biosynthesis C-methylase UbiE
MMNDRMKGAYDIIAAEFARQNEALPPALESLAHKVLALAGAGPRILDIGCGAGRDMAWLEAHGATVTGVDLSPGMLAEAKIRVCGTLLEMDMRSLTFPDGSFDVVWSIASLLHIPKSEAQGVIGEFHRVLHPGGLLALSLQEGTGEQWEASYLYPEFADVERFFARYSPEEVAELLEHGMFSIAERQTDSSNGKGWLSFIACRE